MSAVSFAAGVVAGIVATALVAFLIFKARVIAGQTTTRLPDARMVIAVIALFIAVIALVRSGHTSTNASTHSSDTTDEPRPTAPTTATSGGTATSTTTSTVFTSVTVPNVVGAQQADAIKQLKRVGLDAKIELLPLSSAPPGFVVTQAPVALSTTTTHAIVTLGVSSGG